LKFTRHILQKY